MFAPDECSDVCLVPSVRPYHIGMESLDLFFLEYPSSRLTIAFLSSEISMCPLSRTSGLLGLFFDRGVEFSWQNACFVAHLGRFLAVF